MIDKDEKYRLLGIGNGIIDGFPVINGRVLKRVNGNLKAFVLRVYEPWEEPQEDTEFPEETLNIVNAIDTDDLDSLPQEMQDAIAAEESDEAVSNIAGSGRFLKITHWWLLKAMKYYYSQNPQYLADWHAAVDRLYPDAKPWD